MHDGMEHAGGHHHHDHVHEHTHETPKNSAEIKALLTYTLQHNVHHAEELADMKATLEQQGFADAAAQLAEAMSTYEKGNTIMKTAVDLIKE